MLDDALTDRGAESTRRSSHSDERIRDPIEIRGRDPQSGIVYIDGDRIAVIDPLNHAACEEIDRLRCDRGEHIHTCPKKPLSDLWVARRPLSRGRWKNRGCDARP